MPINWDLDYIDEVAPLPPLEQLQAEAELLRMIQFWREEAERLKDDHYRLEQARKRAYLARKENKG